LCVCEEETTQLKKEAIWAAVAKVNTMKFFNVYVHVVDHMLRVGLHA
jgi:hypothetical protein